MEPRNETERGQHNPLPKDAICRIWHHGEFSYLAKDETKKLVDLLESIRSQKDLRIHVIEKKGERRPAATTNISLFTDDDEGRKKRNEGKSGIYYVGVWDIDLKIIEFDGKDQYRLDEATIGKILAFVKKDQKEEQQERPGQVQPIP